MYIKLTACVKIFDCVMREFCISTQFNDEHEQCLKTNSYLDYIVSVNFCVFKKLDINMSLQYIVLQQGFGICYLVIDCET